MSTVAKAGRSAGAPLRVGRRALRLTNLHKVLYPRAGFTKGQVIEYYLRIAPAIVPHLKNRPLTLKRYPDGVEGEFFYEKRCPRHRPPWMRTAAVPSQRSGAVDYCTVNDAAALVWVANTASLELHTLLSRAPALGRPTMLVFDLDPGPPAGIADAAAVALQVRGILEVLGLRAWAKTSGGKGVHLYVPLNTPCTFGQTKDFARAVAMIVEKNDPRRVTSNMKRDLRPGRVFIDWSQNDEHKTTACPYSLRAGPTPTVSAPVSWDEVARAAAGDADLTFDPRDVLRRVAASGDLLEPVLTLRQRLPDPL